MGSENHIVILTFTFLVSASIAVAVLVKEQPLVLKYHNGPLLKGNITVNLIWYGKFTAIQRSVIVDFINSLASNRAPVPSASTWWRTTERYKGGASTLVVRRQLLNENFSLGKSLKDVSVVALASKFRQTNAVNVVLTSSDVTVEGFCTSRCGTHRSVKFGDSKKVAYVWVGNAETQCPGYCAWPFYKPVYGPQTALVSPNGDIGVDGMIINLATLLAGTVTNPFSNGYFQGPATDPLEAVSSCQGQFGSGSYQGYTGELLVDTATGASYNAHGINGRKYLLPAMWDPLTSGCKTLV